MSDTVNGAIYTEGLTDTHPLFDVYLPIWLKNKDAVDGEEAVKGYRQETYLPPLVGMRADKLNGQALYNIYLEYANWFNASGRTADGLRGLVFRKPPVVNIPDDMTALLDDINFRNQTIEGFAKELFTEVLIKNRVGVLVDFPNASGESLTIADAEAKNLRPYTSKYNAENIWNWREERINNKWQTSWVTLKEVEYEAGTNEFDSIEVDIIRVLDFSEEGWYRQRVYKKKNPITSTTGVKTVGETGTGGTGTGYQFEEEIIPKIDGKPLDFIPFIPITGNGIDWDIDFPVLNDLVNVNIAHYRNSANYENGLLFTGNPTPCVAGLADDGSSDQTLRLGSSTILQFKQDGKWGFLEFSGAGLSEIREAMLEKKEEMAVLGARILSSDKKAVEAAETASIHRAGEHGVLGDIANSVSMGLERVFQIMALWMGVPVEDIEIKLNTDFNPQGLNPQQLTAIMGLWQQGRLSNSDLFMILKKGEIIGEEKTFDEYEEELEEQGPPLGMIGVNTITEEVEEEPEDDEDNL